MSGPSRTRRARLGGKALRRTANPSHFSSLVRRGKQCYRERGAEALGRRSPYRVDLMTKGELAFRADIPLKRELREQQKAIFPQMAHQRGGAAVQYARNAFSGRWWTACAHRATRTGNWCWWTHRMRPRPAWEN